MISIFNDLKEQKIMTKLDELVSFILSDKLKEIRNFECYDELVAEAQKLQREQVKNINYNTVLPTAICCNANCNEPVHKDGSVYCEFHASL